MPKRGKNIKLWYDRCHIIERQGLYRVSTKEDSESQINII